MKLTNCKIVGRFTRPDGSQVNVHKGRYVGRSTDHLFWLYRNKRQFINENEFRRSWKLVSTLEVK
jgi:hypothetical protein